MLPRALAVICLLGFSAAAVPVTHAQGLREIMDTLTKPTAAAEEPQASPQEQEAWVAGQEAAAAALLKEDSLKALSLRVQAAGLPESRVEDFTNLAREVQRSASLALDSLRALGSAPAASPAPPPVAEDEHQAAAIRDSLRRAELEERSAGIEGDLVRRAIEQQMAALAEAEREGRQAREELASAKGEEARDRAALQVELADWKKRALEVAAFAARWRLAQQEAKLQRAGQEAEGYREALRVRGFDRQLSPTRAAARLAALDAEVATLEKRLAEAQTARDEAVDARQALPADAPRLRRTALDLAVDAAKGRLLSIEGLLRLAALEQAHWQAVTRAAANPDVATLRDTRSRTESELASIEEWRPLMDRRLLEAKGAVEEIQRQAAEQRKDPGGAKIFERAERATRSRVEALDELASRTDEVLQLKADLRAELGRDLERSGAAEKVGLVWADLAAWVQGLWRFEVYHIGDASVTVGKILLALLGVVAAFFLSRCAAVYAGRTASRKFRMDATQIVMLEKIIFFPFAALLLFTILIWLNIPLGAFAFLGGALAIGVGFGAQNLMNNFISGLILLTERQIKTGDIIEIAGSTGRVTHLGSRCSRIRRFDGVEVLVPNSAFLEKEVVNWTLNDPHHRFDFTVGVAYGSPVDRVMELLLAAVVAEPDILREPAPGVFFESFGDSSLVFRVFYWLDVAGTSDSRDVGSKIRCEIDRTFREAGIEMPFPQRDIHLRSAEPLRVKVDK